MSICFDKPFFIIWKATVLAQADVIKQKWWARDEVIYHGFHDTKCINQQEASFLVVAKVMVESRKHRAFKADAGSRAAGSLSGTDANSRRAFVLRLASEPR